MEDADSDPPPPSAPPAPAATDAATAPTRPTSGDWTRVDVPSAGISIEHHVGWATIEEAATVYQRFSGEGAVSVRWGPDATIDSVLAHLGLGSGSTRTIETDVATTVDGLAARRIEVVVTGPEVRGTTPAGDRVRHFVYVGFAVGATPVVVGYRAPASELAAVKPALERVLGSVRRR